MTWAGPFSPLMRMYFVSQSSNRRNVPFWTDDHLAVFLCGFFFQFEVLVSEKVRVEILRNDFVENLSEFEEMLFGRHHQQAEPLGLVQGRVVFVTASFS